jgi:hypothetical protein
VKKYHQQRLRQSFLRNLQQRSFNKSRLLKMFVQRRLKRCNLQKLHI